MRDLDYIYRTCVCSLVRPQNDRYCLLERCLEHGEPALLVGETGIGKTTACQLLAASRGQRLHILNCNQHTETSDFLGGYRPNRSRRTIAARLREAAGAFPADVPAGSSDHQLMIDIRNLLDSPRHKIDGETRSSWLKEIAAYHAPFEWVDGPLIHAMRDGDILLIDELNLAEDAVLERLNRYAFRARLGRRSPLTFRRSSRAHAAFSSSQRRSPWPRRAADRWKSWLGTRISRLSAR